MNNKTKLITLICCSLMWFVFGTIILLRASKDIVSLYRYSGSIEEIGITKSVGPKRTIDVLYFKLNGLEQTLGIYHNTIEDYDRYLNKLKKGDQINVFFDKDGETTGENINLHVSQLEKEGEVLLSKEKLDSMDRKVSAALYCMGLLFAVPAFWFYSKKIKKTPADNV